MQVNHGSDDQQAATQILRLLENAVMILKEQWAREAHEALRFNFLEAFSMEWSERRHTQFLAYLLNPKAKHDQGGRFMKSFLKAFCSEIEAETMRYDQVSILPEFVAGESGILDLLIRLSAGRLIIIENKVNAGEGNEQIRRYEEWLETQPTAVGGEHIILFLTPDGRESITAKHPERIKCLSYAKIAHWLDFELRRGLPDRLTSVLRQYVESCYRIAGLGRSLVMDSSLPKTLREALRDRDNLKAAIVLFEQFPNMRKELQEEFWKRVKTILEERLSELQSKDNSFQGWEVMAASNMFGKFADLVSIRWKQRINDYDTFYAAYEAQGEDCQQVLYGIKRTNRWEGIVEHQQDPAERQLKDILKAKNIMKPSNKWWPGYVYLESLGLSAFQGRMAEELLAFQEDDQDPAHSLARRIADLLWELFEICRAQLEYLNKSYPYHQKP